MVKTSGGVAMLKDVTDWRPPRRNSGVIILSPPKAATPPSPTPPVDLSESSEIPGSESPLPHALPTSGGDQYDRGVMKLSDSGPWVWAPSKPVGGLIIGNKWIPLDRSPDESAPPQDGSDTKSGDRVDAPRRLTC